MVCIVPRPHRQQRDARRYDDRGRPLRAATRYVCTGVAGCGRRDRRRGDRRRPGDALVGTATEKQFRFQGALAQQKPFRDWLAEILSAGLGYYTWDFGKLRLGSRINASATDAFTLGNMLFQSLRLEPVDATFEHKIYDFADQAYQYQANIADYQDKSHALYYGRAGAPLTSRSHLLGCATLSQALRLAAVVTREEIGGISPAEWKSARNASWRTTILALTTAPGKVASITHPDVPGGYGDFRIQSLRINKDWSVDITGKTVTPSMYDLTVGPKPKDVVPDPLPGMIYPIPFGPAWAPFQIQANANDALFPGEYTFDSDQEYPPMKDGSSAAQLIITGKLPEQHVQPRRERAGYRDDYPEHHGRVDSRRRDAAGQLVRQRRQWAAVYACADCHRAGPDRHQHELGDALGHRVAGGCGPGQLHALCLDAG